MTLVFLSLLACADPTAGKSLATVEAPAPTATTTIPAATPGIPLHGRIGFVAAKITREHIGQFGTWTGTAHREGGTLTGLEFTVDTNSASTGVDRLDSHLRSADFFDAARYPQASFVTTAITPGAPADSQLAGATHTVEGDLVLHGVTRHLRFPAVIEPGAGVKAHTEFAINRQDFGIAYPGKPDDLIRDEVLIKVDIASD